MSNSACLVNHLYSSGVLVLIAGSSNCRIWRHQRRQCAKIWPPSVAMCVLGRNGVAMAGKGVTWLTEGCCRWTKRSGEGRNWVWEGVWFGHASFGVVWMVRSLFGRSSAIVRGERAWHGGGGGRGIWTSVAHDFLRSNFSNHHMYF